MNTPIEHLLDPACFICKHQGKTKVRKRYTVVWCQKDEEFFNYNHSCDRFEPTCIEGMALRHIDNLEDYTTKLTYAKEALTQEKNDAPFHNAGHYIEDPTEFAIRELEDLIHNLPRTKEILSALLFHTILCVKEDVFLLDRDKLEDFTKDTIDEGYCPLCGEVNWDEFEDRIDAILRLLSKFCR